jgi:hypothetical protein
MKHKILLRGIIVLGITLVLTACTQSKELATKDDKTLGYFTDKDIDNAYLQVADKVIQLLGTEQSDALDGAELPALPDVSVSSGDFTAQAVLPGGSGFIYYIQNQPNSATQPWQVYRYDQS